MTKYSLLDVYLVVIYTYIMYNKHIFRKGNKMTRRQLIKQRKQDTKNVILFCFASLPVIGFAMAYGHMLANGGVI